MYRAAKPTTLQVLGDSYAIRFCNFANSNPVLTGKLLPVLVRGISGAKVSDLKSYVKLNRSSLQQDLPLLFFLGTNDFLANSDIVKFKNTFLSFLRMLRRNYPRMVIVFATLPCYPRIVNSTPAVTRLQQINKFFLTLRSDFVKVIDLPQELSHIHYFHIYYGSSRRRDKIHFNGDAFQKLIPLIENSLSPMSA